MKLLEFHIIIILYLNKTDNFLGMFVFSNFIELNVFFYNVSAFFIVG